MTSTERQTVQYIDTKEKLAWLADALDQQMTVAVDLEADSMHHYRERVCLIQIATQNTCAIVDPLQVRDLSPLKSMFINPGIQKIFHGADYDVRSLYRDFKIRIINLFDTELASRLLGMTTTGLDAVLSMRFSVRLDKRFQKKDWSKRPLPQEMIEYAACDVLYLIPLAAELTKELETKTRLAWANEECELLSRVRPVSNNGKPLFLRFKGAGKLDPRSLTLLEALLVFRDRIAKKRDKPHFKILRNQSLLNIAINKTANLDFIQQSRFLSPKEIARYGDAIQSVIHKSLAVSNDNLLIYPYQPTPRVKPIVRKRIKTLKQWRDGRAKSLCLDPALICNKTQMSVIAHENPKTKSDLEKIAEIKNWQLQTFGDELLQTLNNT